LNSRCPHTVQMNIFIKPASSKIFKIKYAHSE
jgi:hypothetical protein